MTNETNNRVAFIEKSFRYFFNFNPFSLSLSLVRDILKIYQIFINNTFDGRVMIRNSISLTGVAM